MLASRDEILTSALKLSESDRLLIAARLLDTLPDDAPGLSFDDANLLEELERRAEDTAGGVAAADLWTQD
ncbi:MAG: hypothetical protein WD875_00595 [Pirellulales bacterium]